MKLVSGYQLNIFLFQHFQDMKILVVFPKYLIVPNCLNFKYLILLIIQKIEKKGNSDQ